MGTGGAAGIAVGDIVGGYEMRFIYVGLLPHPLLPKRIYRGSLAEVGDELSTTMTSGA